MSSDHPSPAENDPDLHPIVTRYLRYINQRISDAAGDDLMCDFYFTSMEQELNSDGAARELAAALLVSAREVVKRSLKSWASEGGSAERKAYLAKQEHRASELFKAHSTLAASPFAHVTWGQTRLRLLVRWQLDGVAALARLAVESYDGALDSPRLLQFFLNNVLGHRTKEWANRHVDDHTTREKIQEDVSGGTATALGSGVHALSFYSVRIFTGADVRSSKSVAPDMDFDLAKGVSAPGEGNEESHAVGVRFAKMFCADHVREIRSGPLSGFLMVSHPAWPHGFFSDEHRHLHRLVTPTGDPVDLTSLETIPVGFEESAASLGRGRSSELAHFLACVLLTLEADVLCAATGALRLEHSILSVAAVAGVPVKTAAAARAGIRLVVIPYSNTPPEDEPGVQVVQVRNLAEALYAVCEHGASQPAT